MQIVDLSGLDQNSINKYNETLEYKRWLLNELIDVEDDLATFKRHRSDSFSKQDETIREMFLKRLEAQNNLSKKTKKNISKEAKKKKKSPKQFNWKKHPEYTQKLIEMVEDNYTMSNIEYEFDKIKKYPDRDCRLNLEAKLYELGYRSVPGTNRELWKKKIV